MNSCMLHPPTTPAKLLCQCNAIAASSGSWHRAAQLLRDASASMCLCISGTGRQQSRQSNQQQCTDSKNISKQKLSYPTVEDAIKFSRSSWWPTQPICGQLQWPVCTSCHQLSHIWHHSCAELLHELYGSTEYCLPILLYTNSCCQCRPLMLQHLFSTGTLSI
jgi:hypothetical protein